MIPITWGFGILYLLDLVVGVGFDQHQSPIPVGVNPFVIHLEIGGGSDPEFSPLDSQDIHVTGHHGATQKAGLLPPLNLC